MNSPTNQSSLPRPGASKELARIASFEKNPANGGMPAIARVAARNVQYVIGIFDFRPPM